MYSLKTILLIGVAFILASGVAVASLPLTQAGSQVTGGGPPVCSNSLDFTDACNSQYISVIL